MKRGLIAWSPAELPREALEARLERLRTATASLGAAAALVSTDLWRSNHARALVNFMPFWSRSLLVVPAEDVPILICGHSPRVYPWVRTMTFAELRPGGNLVEPLLALFSEEGWTRLAVVDRRELAYDVHSALVASEVELLDLPSSAVFVPADETEREMRRTAVERTRRLVESHLDGAVGERERGLVGRLERALRGGGMEDVVLWMSDGETLPRPARDGSTNERSSIIVASEYRGHWCQLGRPLAATRASRAPFVEALRDVTAFGDEIYDLSGALPFQALAPGTPLVPGGIVSLHLRDVNGRYYGDTCIAKTETSAEIL